MSTRAHVADAVGEARFGVHFGEDQFNPLSNFCIEYEYEVKAGTESGFLCKVIINNPGNLQGCYQG